MLKITALFIAFLLTTMTAFADAINTPVGIWLTIDDNTHKPTALIQITQGNGGILSAKVIKGLRSGDSSERRCTECTDERKDQKIQGMIIMKNMKKVGVTWNGGTILDPNNGKEYSCNMHLEESGGKLVVRGYIGFSLLGRSQIWIRQNDTISDQVKN